MVNGNLPDGWTRENIRQVITKIPLTGRKLPQREYLESGKYPDIDQGQIYIGGYSDDKDLLVPCELPVIVFGDHTKAIKYVNFPFVAGADGVKVIKPSSEFLPKLFYYFLQAIELPNKGYARHFQYLEKETIPLPPLPEQERIVAKIEELFTQLEAGTAALERVQAGLKRYKASVLKAAVEGKLVQQDANDEHASVLYKRILENRKLRWKAELEKKGGKAKSEKYSEPVLPDIENEDLPNGWVWASLDSLTYRVTYGITVRPKYVEEGIPIISAREIRSGEIDLEISHKISIQDYQNLRHNCILYYDDILFSKTGTIGHVARVKVETPLSVSQNVAVLSPVVWSK